MKMKSLTLLACFGLIPGLFSTFAQDTGEDQLGAWYMYFGTNRLNLKWSLHTEAQFRYYEVAGNFNQTLLRTGANYHISDKAMVTLGYAYIATDTNFEEYQDEKNSLEHRIFQQFILKNAMGNLAVEHRYRLEQRFLEHYGAHDTQHRVRYRLQLTYPIGSSWFFNVYDEIFINLQEPLFGQNRLYAALGYKVNAELSLQVGYLKNHFPGRHYDRLQLAVFINTDFSGKSTQP